MLYCSPVTARRIVPAVAALVVLVLAAIGYARYIPTHKTVTTRLAALLPSKAPAGFSAKPASAAPVNASSNPYSEVATAAKRSPSRTGSYSIQWTKAPPSTDTETVLLSLLPTDSDAAKANSQAESLYIAEKSLQPDGYAYGGPVNAGIPGAKGSSFVSTAPTGGPPLAVIVFQLHRAQVTMFGAAAGSASKSAAAATSLAHTEYGLLKQRLGSFTLVKTSWPVVATIVFWAVTAGLVLLVVLGPVGIRKGRERRRVAREIARRRQLQSRGSKISRRQAQRVR